MFKNTPLAFSFTGQKLSCKNYTSLHYRMWTTIAQRSYGLQYSGSFPDDTFFLESRQTTETIHLSLAPEIRRLECETNHPFLPTAEFKNVWCFTSTPLYILLVCCLGRETTTSFIFWKSQKRSVYYMGGKNRTERIHQKRHKNI